MLRTFVRSISNKTLTSTKDGALLDRLKVLNLQGGKVVKRVETRPPNEEELYRCMSLPKVSKLIRTNLADPLTWNNSVLGRIYGVPEDMCDSLCRYVRPLTYLTKREMDETQKILKSTFVVDVARLISDKYYYPAYSKLKLPEKTTEKTLPAHGDQS